VGRALSYALVGLVASTVAGAVAACSSPEKAAGQGDSCFVTDECGPGLACIAQADGTRRCTSDLSSVQTLPPEAGGPADAAPAEAGDAPSEPDAMPAEGAPPPPPDTGVPPPPDTGVPPPQDTGAPPPPDTGTPPPPDTGVPPPPDTGAPPPPDTGSPDDAGAPPDSTAD
jgi:hypothetical protein